MQVIALLRLLPVLLVPPLLLATWKGASQATGQSDHQRDAVASGPVSKGVTMAAETGGGHILLPIRLNGQGPFWAMLDTGNQGTAIFRSVADRLALQTEPYGEMQGLGAGSLPVEKAARLAVSLGERAEDAITFTEPIVTVLPDNVALAPIDGKQIDVFLGASLIERFALTIDAAAGMLTFRDAALFEPPAGSQIMPIQLEAGFPYVLGAVTPDSGPMAGVPIRGAFLLDLGAAFGVQLDHDAAQAAGLLDPDLPGRRVVGLIAGIDGDAMEIATVPVRRIVMAGVELDEREIVVLPVQGGGPPIANLVGTIGVVAFEDRTITLDYQRRRLVIH